MTSTTFGATKAAKVNGTTLAYREEGEGEPVVFVHGVLSDLRTWEQQLPAVGRTYRAITYSLRFARPNVDIDPEADDPMLPHVEDLAAFLREVGAEPAHLVGNSGGAFIMGGLGSGTWHRRNTKRTVDSCDRLYIWELDRIGFIPSEGHFAGNWGWSESGRGIAFTVTSSELELRYYANADQTADLIEQRVPIERTHCNFGGSRPWFRCGACNRRVAMLVLVERFFLCRQCHGLPYRSQREHKPERARRKVQQIQRRLGNPDWRNTLYPAFPKPKGMWRRTHARLVEEAEQSLGVSQGQLLRQLERLETRNHE